MKKKKLGELVSMTKGQMEAGISNALISFEKEHMGRSPGKTVRNISGPPGEYDY